MTATATRIHLTVSPDFVKLLKRAKAGQSHVQPNATDEQVLTTALELLLEKQSKRKARVPAKVKQEVMERDLGKCTWPTHDGGICGSTVRLEIDHVVPKGRGGEDTVANCRVLCDLHNQEAARQVYGDAHMDLFTMSRRDPVAREDEAEYGTPPDLIPMPVPLPGSFPLAVVFPPCPSRKRPRSASSACASPSCSSSRRASSR